jgi:predicted anti-sigma-YlaC factor YlaD
MSHQPFEDWLFLGEGLPTQQERLLREHLTSCPRCRQLAQAWAEADGFLRATPEAAPAPGFVQRWQARQADERARTGMRQVRRVLGLTVGLGALVSFLIGAEVVSLLQSPAELAVRLIDQAMTWIVQVFVLREVLETLLDAARAGVSSYWWLGLPIVLGGLGVLWIASLYRYALKGVAQ